MANRMVAPSMQNQSQVNSSQVPYQNQTQFTPQQVGMNTSAQQFTQGSNNAVMNITGQQQIPLGQQIQQQLLSSPNKESSAQMPSHMNAASICRMGQESVQELVSKMHEIFQIQKQLALLPKTTQGTLPVTVQERYRNRLEECLNQAMGQMRNLRLIYNKVVSTCGDVTEYTDINLIPYEDEPAIKPVHSPEYQYASEELKEIAEQVRLKNRQLKEIIDKLRTIVWEINTMMATRYT